MKNGDIVKLKSGGPDMTIEEIECNYKTNFKEICRCVWFEEKELKQAYFSVDVLKSK